jgi:arginyl-tRNA--protein-N-Asp/Glu arginylyltransferase
VNVISFVVVEMPQQYYLASMFAEKHYPEIIAPEELDTYLSRAWYRMGQTIFTTHFLCFGRNYYSALWVRLSLEGYAFRKSLRKVLRKNGKRFDTVVRRGSIDIEKEKLYQHYKSSFNGLLAPTLRDSLLDGEEYNIYNTYEVAVYDAGELVALSYFDLGLESAASITGIYHPAYSNYSLGFYTMLKEVEFAMEAGLKYFYPGYVVPGYPRFDYKLRIGAVDYYQLASEKWHPYASLKPEDIPIHAMEKHLLGMQQYLSHHHVKSSKLYYPLFEAGLFIFWNASYFDYPCFLLCSPRYDARQFLILVYNPRSNAYELIQCSLFDDLQFYFNEAYTQNFDPQHNFAQLITKEHVIFTSQEPKQILAVIRQLQQSGEAKR